MPESESQPTMHPSARYIPKLVALRILRAYKWAVSPMFPPSCRYVPTCSEYAMEAVERFGALRGGLMSLARLSRCHPFARGGYDPVVKHRRVELSSERPTTDDRRPTTSDPHYGAMRGNC